MASCAVRPGHSSLLVLAIGGASSLHDYALFDMTYDYDRADSALLGALVNQPQMSWLVGPQLL